MFEVEPSSQKSAQSSLWVEEKMIYDVVKQQRSFFPQHNGDLIKKKKVGGGGLLNYGTE